MKALKDYMKGIERLHATCSLKWSNPASIMTFCFIIALHAKDA